jgi:hypothetical protein
MMHNDTPRHHAHGRAHANITSRAGRKGRSARLRWIARLLVAEVVYVSAMRLGLAILVRAASLIDGGISRRRSVASQNLAILIGIPIHGLCLAVHTARFVGAKPTGVGVSSVRWCRGREIDNVLRRRYGRRKIERRHDFHCRCRGQTI